MEILFYPDVKAEILGIYRMTNKKWGKQQAKKYVAGLYEAIELAAKKQKIWRKYNDLGEDMERPVYFVSYEKHYVFFEVFEKEKVIGVIGVFHAAMDIPVRLLDTIVNLGRKPIDRVH